MTNILEDYAAFRSQMLSREPCHPDFDIIAGPTRLSQALDRLYAKVFDEHIRNEFEDFQKARRRDEELEKLGVDVEAMRSQIRAADINVVLGDLAFRLMPLPGPDLSGEKPSEAQG